ncbi:MAG: ClbS/DfsB family four-helix bundle protein [Candidatus Limimorpha sp.]
MERPQDKETLKVSVISKYDEMMQLIDATDKDILGSDFTAALSGKCSTFEQGNNMRDILMHIYEWQQLQLAFVNNIRNGDPKDFIPEPYRKNYHEMDRDNWMRHQAIHIDEAICAVSKSHLVMLELMDSFSENELFGKKVFKNTYTTTMAAYFLSVTYTPYNQAVRRLKSHIRSMKKK